ncbi:MAG: TatD family hydrolase, partial [Rickettsiaceae bacterium]|nr:TatD family hydrolase [Rickettsiaceae bacterium]
NYIYSLFTMSDFLIDTHCHLNLGHLKENIPLYIDNASKKGVKYLHTICTQISEFSEILNISNSFENIYCSVGVHPCNVTKEDLITTGELIKFSLNPKVISFGETGLDYYHPGFNKDLQQESFYRHICASQETNLPVIVHTRDAKIDTLNIIASNMKEKSFPGIIHCFTEDLEFAKKMLDLGMYISIAGIVTFKNATILQDAARYIPLDRLLIETDAPYLAPTPVRSKPNEPSYITHTAEFIAALRDINYEEFIRLTSENTRRIFPKGNFL